MVRLAAICLRHRTGPQPRWPKAAPRPYTRTDPAPRLPSRGSCARTPRRQGASGAGTAGTHPQEDSAIRPRAPASSHAQRKLTPGQRLALLYHVRVEKIRKLDLHEHGAYRQRRHARRWSVIRGNDPLPLITRRPSCGNAGLGVTWLARVISDSTRHDRRRVWLHRVTPGSLRRGVRHLQLDPGRPTGRPVDPEEHDLPGPVPPDAIGLGRITADRRKYRVWARRAPSGAARRRCHLICHWLQDLCSNWSPAGPNPIDDETHGLRADRRASATATTARRRPVRSQGVQPGRRRCPPAYGPPRSFD